MEPSTSPTTQPPSDLTLQQAMEPSQTLNSVDETGQDLSPTAGATLEYQSSSSLTETNQNPLNEGSLEDQSMNPLAETMQSLSLQKASSGTNPSGPQAPETSNASTESPALENRSPITVNATANDNSPEVNGRKEGIFSKLKGALNTAKAESDEGVEKAIENIGESLANLDFNTKENNEASHATAENSRPDVDYQEMKRKFKGDGILHKAKKFDAAKNPKKPRTSNKKESKQSLGSSIKKRATRLFDGVKKHVKRSVQSALHKTVQKSQDRILPSLRNATHLLVETELEFVSPAAQPQDIDAEDAENEGDPTSAEQATHETRVKKTLSSRKLAKSDVRSKPQSKFGDDFIPFSLEASPVNQAQEGSAKKSKEINGREQKGLDVWGLREERRDLPQNTNHRPLPKPEETVYVSKSAKRQCEEDVDKLTDNFQDFKVSKRPRIERDETKPGYDWKKNCEEEVSDIDEEDSGPTEPAESHRVVDEKYDSSDDDIILDHPEFVPRVPDNRFHTEIVAPHQQTRQEETFASQGLVEDDIEVADFRTQDTPSQQQKRQEDFFASQGLVEDDIEVADFYTAPTKRIIETDGDIILEDADEEVQNVVIQTPPQIGEADCNIDAIFTDAYQELGLTQDVDTTIPDAPSEQIQPALQQETLFAPTLVSSGIQQLFRQEVSHTTVETTYYSYAAQPLPPSQHTNVFSPFLAHPFVTGKYTPTPIVSDSVAVQSNTTEDCVIADEESGVCFEDSGVFLTSPADQRVANEVPADTQIVLEKQAVTEQPAEVSSTTEVAASEPIEGKDDKPVVASTEEPLSPQTPEALFDQGSPATAVDLESEPKTPSPIVLELPVSILEEDSGSLNQYKKPFIVSSEIKAEKALENTITCSSVDTNAYIVDTPATVEDNGAKSIEPETSAEDETVTEEDDTVKSDRKMETSQKQAFGAPAPAFGAPASAFGTPAPAFGAPAPAFGTTTSAFGAPASTFAPISAFGAPTSAFGTSNKPAATPQSAFGAPISAFGQPAPKSAFAAPSSDVPAGWAKPIAFGAPSPAASTPQSSADSPEPSVDAFKPKNAFTAPTSNPFTASSKQQPASSITSHPAVQSAFAASTRPEPERPTPITEKVNEKAKATISKRNNDSSEDMNESRKARFTTEDDISVQYANAKAARDKERAREIAAGTIPDGAIDFQDAKPIVGTCKDMCPYFERIERAYQNNIDPLERGPDGKMDHSKVVKSFHRPAAGMEAAIPSDLRDEKTLEKTLQYLIHDLVGENPLKKVHSFVRDRTRSIRQDYSIQHLENMSMVSSTEKIARFHLASIHLMQGETGFDTFQELEQLRKSLLTLMQWYNEFRGVSPNEAEFRAYNILLSLYDNALAVEAANFPIEVGASPYVQRALEIQQLFLDGEYAVLHSRSQDLTYLESCALLAFISTIARLHLMQINGTRSKQSRSLKIDKVSEALNLPREEAVRLLEYYGIEIRPDDPDCWVPRSAFADWKSIEKINRNGRLLTKVGDASLVDIIEYNAPVTRVPKIVKQSSYTLTVPPEIQQVTAQSLSSLDANPGITVKFSNSGFDWKGIKFAVVIQPTSTQSTSESSALKTPLSAFASPAKPLFAPPVPAPQSVFAPKSSFPPQSAFPPQPAFAPQSAFPPQPTQPPTSVFAPVQAKDGAVPPPKMPAFNPEAKAFVPRSAFPPPQPVKEEPVKPVQEEAAKPTVEQKVEEVKATPVPESKREVKPEAPKVVEEPLRPATPIPTPEPEPEPWIEYEKEYSGEDSELTQYFMKRLPEAVSFRLTQLDRRINAKVTNKTQALLSIIRDMHILQLDEDLTPEEATRRIKAEFAKQLYGRRAARSSLRKLKREMQKRGIKRPEPPVLKKKTMKEILMLQYEQEQKEAERIAEQKRIAKEKELEAQKKLEEEKKEKERNLEAARKAKLAAKITKPVATPKQLVVVSPPPRKFENALQERIYKKAMANPLNKTLKRKSIDDSSYESFQQEAKKAKMLGEERPRVGGIPLDEAHKRRNREKFASFVPEPRIVRVEKPKVEEKMSRTASLFASVLDEVEREVEGDILSGKLLLGTPNQKRRRSR